MIGRRGRAALACLAGAVAATAAAGQGTMTIGLNLEADSIPAAPLITTTATGFPAEFCPCATAIEISTRPQFDDLFASASREGVSVSFTLQRLLPERETVFFRARLFDRFGTIRAEQVLSGVTRSRLRLIRPVAFNFPVFTSRPTFVWSSSSVTSPPGPWLYDLTITNTATQQVAFMAAGITDTSYTLPTPLEANASYRWQVRASAASGDPADFAVVASAASFVISSPDAPVVTLVHHTFPNPFPQAWTDRTCIWVDLAVRSRVRLNVVDIRHQLVRSLFDEELPAGAHGRAASPGGTGCDSRLSWDGTDDRGRTVPPGAYILVFESEADRVRKSVKMLFSGR